MGLSLQILHCVHSSLIPLEATDLNTSLLPFDLAMYALPLLALIVGGILFLVAPFLLRAEQTGRDE